jgi:hypothetical protein
MALAIVRHGVTNVKTYGDIQHPLYQVSLHALPKEIANAN